MVKKEELIELVKKEYATSGTAPLRWFFYRLVSAGYLPNNHKEYKRLSDILARAREEEILPWELMIDQERQKNGHEPFYSTPLHRMRWTLKDLKDFSISINRWFFQPIYIEVWCEKKTLTPFLADPITNLDVVYIPSHGYTSVTFLKDNANRLMKINKPKIILYAGDWDPSGEDIERNVKAKLEQYGVKDIDIQHVCLSEDQIKAYKLPPMMAKPADTRTKKFIEKHGNETVELDALHPTEILKLIIAKIDALFDKSIESKRIIWEAAEQEYVKRDLPRKVKIMFGK